MKESAQLSGAYNPLGASLMQEKGAPESMGAWSQGTLSEKDRREQEGLDLPILMGEATWVQDLCRAPRSALRKVAGRAGHKWIGEKPLPRPEGWVVGVEEEGIVGSGGGNPSRFCWCLVTSPGPHSLAAPAPTVGKIKLDWWLPSQSRSRWASFDQWTP